MTDDVARRIADTVRAVLSEPGLERDARALALERLEAQLTERARALHPERATLSVSLTDEGALSLHDASGAVSDAGLTQRLALDLMGRLARVMGAARADAKQGVQPSQRRVLAPVPEPVEAAVEKASVTGNAEAPHDELRAMVRALVDVVARQQSRIEALEAQLGAEPDLDAARALASLRARSPRG